MTRTEGLDGLLNRNGWALLAVALLFCSLCAGPGSGYAGLNSTALAAVVFIGTFLVSIAMLAGFKLLRIL